MAVRAQGAFSFIGVDSELYTMPDAGARCTNANVGTFNHECGARATWTGTHYSGYQQTFCDRCKLHGSESRTVRSWARIE